MATAMLGALGQVVVHDIIPTFIELRAAKIADAKTDPSSENGLGTFGLIESLSG